MISQRIIFPVIGIDPGRLWYIVSLRLGIFVQGCCACVKGLVIPVTLTSPTPKGAPEYFVAFSVVLKLA